MVDPGTPPRSTSWAERHLEPAHGLVTGASHRVAVKKESIPIVFVPGIMGTRLRNMHGTRVWDPDKWPGGCWMLFKYGGFGTGPAEKKRALVGDRFHPGFLEPINDDHWHNRWEFLKKYPDGAARGWGGVAWSTYGAVLTHLHDARWTQPVDDWLELPVYAFGYNWSDSCRSSGAKLAARVHKIIEEQRKGGTVHCEKVILVTHSMGGLVARSACFLGPEGGKAADAGKPIEDSVLHIVHGVQPVTGSAAAYWRMKAGFERSGIKGRAVAWVLGSTGAEVTAILANMPGGLELLPSCDYRVAAPAGGETTGSWLRVIGPDGGIEARPDPQHPDPYETIYREQHAFWRLVDPEYLNRVAHVEGRERNVCSLDDDPWVQYEGHLKRAQAFHAALGTRRHGSTNSFHGTGHATSANVVFHRSASYRDALAEEIEREGSLLTKIVVELSKGVAQAVSDRGGFKRTIKSPDGSVFVVVMDEPSEPIGDGTVPLLSGSTLRASSDADHDHAEFLGLEHEPAYTDKKVLEFTRRSIERVCIQRVMESAPG